MNSRIVGRPEHVSGVDRIVGRIVEPNRKTPRFGQPFGPRFGIYFSFDPRGIFGKMIPFFA